MEEVWEEVKCKGDIPSARYAFKGTLVDKNKIFIFGGCDLSTDLSSAYVLNLSKSI